MKKLISSIFMVSVLIKTGLLFGQAPPVPLKATFYNNIRTTSTLDGCSSGYPCIDNRSANNRRNSIHSYRAYGTGTWTVTLQWADTTPTNFVSYGSTGVVTQASPSSAIGYGIDPANASHPYHDYIRFVITGTDAATVTIQNYFGTQNTWWLPATGGISYPLTANQGGTGTSYQTIVYPEVYGAVPGNVVDSGAAFNLALAAAGALPNGAVWCQGSYNMGTTNLLIDTANGASLISPGGGSCRLNWTSGATGTALTIGTTSQTTYFAKLQGVRLITASTSQALLKLIRTHEVRLYDMEMEGPANATDTNDCITLDGRASDSIYTDVLSVNCNHVKRGLVVLSTGGANNVTTWNSNGFKVFGPGAQGTKYTGSAGVDFGSSGNGDGFTFNGGNFENLEYGITSSGGAGSAMHGVFVNGVRFEDVTYGVNIEQFAFGNAVIATGGLVTLAGAGRCISGNVLLANVGLPTSTAASISPISNCLTSTLNINPGLEAAVSRPQTAINMTIPTASSFPIERDGLDTSNRVVYMKNASGMPSIIGEISTLWTPINGVPATVLGPKVASGTYTSNSGLASGTVNTSGLAVTKASGTDFSTAWAGRPIVINGITYTISSVSSTTALTLTTTAGTQTGTAYSVAGSVTGSAGDLCFLQWTNGTLKGLAYVALTGTNAIAPGTALTIVDGGYGFTGTAPTAATFLKVADMYPNPTSKAASCFESVPGGVVVSTTLGGVGGHLVTNSSGTQGNTLYVGEGSDYNLVPTKNPSNSEITVGSFRGALFNPATYQTLWPATGNQQLLWINTDGATATGSWCFQPGNFSAGHGGGLCLFQQANGSKPGSVSLNMGSSVGKVRINNGGNGSGTDVHVWDISGFSTSTGVPFANLGTPAAGTTIWCTNCNVATPCTGGGAGAWAFRVAAGTWTCPF